MSTRPIVAGAARVIGSVSDDIAAGVAKRSAREAGEAGAQRATRDLLEGAGATALRRGAAEVTTDPVAALRRGPQGFLNAQHRTASEGLERLLGEQRRLRPGSAELLGLEGAIGRARQEVAVFTTRQQVDLGRAAAGAVTRETREASVREVYQALGRAHREHAEALVAVGRGDDAISALREAGRAYRQAALRDLTDHGRAWAADLNSAVRLAARAGDAPGAIEALRHGGNSVHNALGLIRQAASVPSVRALERRNTEAVARAIIDDVRSRPFNLLGESIPARPPLTNGQWAEVMRMAGSGALGDDVLHAVMRMS